MWNRERWLLGVAAAGALAGAVWACGPDFPSQLLSDRAATFAATPVNTFAYEAMHLRTASDELKAHEAPAGETREQAPVSPLDAGLPAEQLALLGKMAPAATGDEAYAAGAGLPEAIRLYAAAAIELHQAGFGCAHAADDAGDEPATEVQAHTCAAQVDPQRLGRAERRLYDLLALPPAQARQRAVAAAYMLGEIGLRQFADCGNCKPDDRMATIRGHFAQARVLALQGAPDPQGLAVASYGEEARLYLRAGGPVNDGSADGPFCRWQGFVAGGACPATIAPGNYARAMGLYAEQAARDSQSGVESLRHLSGYAFGHPDLLAGLLDDSLAQRALVAYALAYSADRGAEDAASDDTALGRDRLAALVAAIEQRGLSRVEGADRLAALAYRSGRYELAATLSGRQSGPLSSWVQAKLALRKGDMAAASTAYAQAIRAFPATGEVPGIEPDGVDRLHGEQGALSLARGEYVQALEQLWNRADVWWGDVAYLAERVLTVDELKHFVDTRVPASTAMMQAPEGEASYAYTDGQVGRGTALRELLARRLMRAGRYRDAFGYFREPAAEGAAPTAPTSADDGETPPPQRHRVWAQQYADALQRSESAWTGIGKAEALFRAATIAREHGMEILGYEADPDYYALDGMYQGGLGQDTAKVGAYLTQGEHDRFVASAAKPPRRFHYRYLAADEASRAADLLPPRSQAFAAVLCKATGWMLQGPPDYGDQFGGFGDPKPTALPERLQRAEALYRRYVEQGAYVSWAGQFGRSCEAPDFDRARTLLRQQRIAHVRHLAGHYRWYLVAGALLLLIGLGAVLRRRRRPG
ncbi:hypothetical protein ASG87_07540 [Frateuria sp. Soil773]|uniref:hypothetical protein n=1 Tax=Frateuria sp. Soil773 TaxID=1736407 RepID=UPI0006FE0E2C|nr:hypothetical protein [Frateuria sp. Soil773]KRE88450.1 hypothetical protein ASG87_07540 [Frateuria sp. Soil773]